jgi:hypothetical protein
MRAGRDARSLRRKDFTMTPTPRHTPAPWWDEFLYIVARDPEGRHRIIYIADAAYEGRFGQVASPESQEANRRLIAAAPDLFALVYRLAYSEAPVSQAVDDARALVAKVCGDPKPFAPPDGDSPGDEEPAEPTVTGAGTHDPETNAEDSEEHLPDEVQSDPELWFEICNDPAIWPENRAAAYRAALRGERNWPFAFADDFEGGEEANTKPVGRNVRPSHLRRVK